MEASTRTTPLQFGEEFCNELERDQPALMKMMTEVMIGLLNQSDYTLDEAAVLSGQSLLLVAFVWRAATAQLEAQQMEDE
jgi:hypothetical protein